VTRRGRSSVQIEVEMVAEGMTTGERRSCCTGSFTMVAVGDDGQPIPLSEKNND
jgi:acyl-CoA hydrolase